MSAGDVSDYETIRVSREGRVAVLTLHRPERMNAFTTQMCGEMIDAFERLDADPGVRAIVVTGEGRAFCAGADIEGGFGTMTTENAWTPPVEDGVSRDSGGVLVLAIAEVDTPIIAAVNGAAVGVGFTMLLPMDIVVAAGGAKMAIPFVRRGIAFDGAASYFLPRLVGWARARDWAVTGRTFRSEEAERAGLVSELHPAGEVLPRAMEIAADIADNCAPESIAMVKQALRRSFDNAGADGKTARHAMHMAESRDLNARFVSADCAEGVRAFFEKRAPDFADYAKGA